jgi:hypothetical protein
MRITVRTCTIRWSKLHYEVDLAGCRTDITQSELRGAASFAPQR